MDKKRIVFYSYKGGTGRTLTLANIASYLARFGFKVCIVDMDLEAPGIHYKFLEKTDPRINNMLGVVDYIDYFAKNKTPPPDIKPYLISINENLSIMPSGNVTCNDYWIKLSRINWHALLYEENPYGVKLLLDMLGNIQSDEFGFDYVLIDARAGITPLSGLCVSYFGDVLASFFSASPENMYGTRQMLRNVKETRKKDNMPDIPIITVLTRFEKFENINEEKSFIADKKDFLNDGDDQLCTELFVIHADRELERNERIVYGMSENPKKDYQKSEAPIKNDYLKFFSCLVDDKEMETRIDSVIKKITSASNLLNEPDKVQSELEALAAIYNHKLVFEELIKIYKLRNLYLSDVNKVLSTIARYYDVGGTEKFADESYFDVFLNYDKYKHSEGRSPFDFERIFRLSENASSDKKMQLAQILQRDYIEEHYQKVFDLFEGLLQDTQYSEKATDGILELFSVKEELYRANSNLLVKLCYALVNSRTDDAIDFAQRCIILFIQYADYITLRSLIVYYMDKGLLEEIKPFLPTDNPVVQMAFANKNIQIQIKNKNRRAE